ncbi:hypothetical protein CBL_03572 [Carabus blaptoides fortunei]
MGRLAGRALVLPFFYACIEGPEARCMVTHDSGDVNRNTCVECATLTLPIHSPVMQTTLEGSASPDFAAYQQTVSRASPAVVVKTSSSSFSWREPYRRPVIAPFASATTRVL